MRILRIRLQNLNSLTGEWSIDLTHPAFASDGIFAITGPTGAGKTTILDAVCLALYGRTPRLPRITKSSNEIMSRQSGECFAEVTFETQAGRFRAHWSQRRAHKKPDGELQAPKHEIADADSGTILETKILEVARRIESVTGMDFDRFTRSMLLAQGAFAAFLQAAPDERAPILEQITGTEIYSRISVRVHERRREEREKLNLLQAETAGIALLEPEQEAEIIRDLEVRQKEESALAAQAVETGQALAWLAAMDDLKREIAVLAGEAEKLRHDLVAFAPERERLDQAVRAATLDGVCATISAARQQLAADKNALHAGQKALPELEFAAKEQVRALQTAELQTGRAKEELKAAAPVLQKVRTLDQQLAGQKKAVAEGTAECGKDAAKIDAGRKIRAEEQARRARDLADLERAGGYLQDHTRDEWLIGGLAGVEEQLGALLSRQSEIHQKKAALDKAAQTVEQTAQSLGSSRKQCLRRRQELVDASRRLKQSRDILERLLQGRLLREYRAEKEALLREMAYLARIAELEAHRNKLEDGAPCPLCGATAHPFAKGNVPVPDETEKKIEALTSLIGQAEDQENAVRNAEEAENSARKNLTEAEKLEQTAAHDWQAAGKTLAEVEDELKKLHLDQAAREAAISARLLPLGITEIGNAAALLGNLRTRLKMWQEHATQKADIEKRIAASESELKRLDAVIDAQNTALTEKQQRLGALEKECAARWEERKALYGGKNPDDEERRLNATVSDAENTEKRTRERCHELQQQWNTARAHAEALRQRITGMEPELKRLEAEFSAAFVAAGFSSEEQFLAARLTVPQRTELAARARVLDERQTELNTRQRDREMRLAAETARKISGEARETLELRLREGEETLQALRDGIAALRHRLIENAAARERIREKQTAIEARKKECRRWENLHELIGSADGKKYRNFVQGLTFDLMIGHANRQLRKMTDRYVLIRDSVQPLELGVIDSYQAGETRSTRNLSGGESFIASLALALGLSQMASKNVRVDSLFLDEGFGTLDEDALDTALETLAGLRQDGKLIGVISHVPALKERIAARIRVIPRTGGRSRISGPGCKAAAVSHLHSEAVSPE